MNITIEKIGKEEIQVLMNLVKMYCYEWSQYNMMDVDKEGNYPFEQYVPSFVENKDCACYFAKVDGILAGFSIVDKDFAVKEEADYSMGEYFVMYKYRRYGVGRYMAEYLFNLYKGKWQVGFHPNNITSVKFWNKVVKDYSNNKCILHENCEGLHYHDGTLGNVLTFDSSEK